MSGAEQDGPVSFMLNPSSTRAVASGVDHLPGHIPPELLDRHIVWYCQLRWLVILVLAGYGILSYLPGLYFYFDMRERVVWPLICAALLTVMNALYLSQQWTRAGGAGRAVARMTILWLQIVLDLVVLTAVVHYTGTQDTPAHLAYMFHIVLACIFMSRRMSFLVTVIACVLYGLCIILEARGLISPSSIYQSGLDTAQRAPLTVGITTISTQATWLVVWLLASHLATMVRARDLALSDTHKAFLREKKEKDNQMMTATNELRGLFAAIDANAQVLLGGHCGVLPDDALDVALRISSRSRRLLLEIQDMVQLVKLDSPVPNSEARCWLDLSEVIRDAISKLEPEAASRRIEIRNHLQAGRMRVVGRRSQLQTMLTHVLSNSVLYSHGGGTVEIAGGDDAQGSIYLTVEDHGIGIEAAKISHVFEDYYRTDEAVEHCRESTGLGLAIVRRIAAQHGVAVKVTSEPGKGTVFQLTFPKGLYPSGTKET